tara:strand:+ start:1010 stop:2902 length:1893 start_codon:yes stop_codon:yes gene_type:complete
MTAAKAEIQKFITKQNKLDTLRFITCGSVDDGKSTLLGRMLYEAQLIFDDQVDSLVKDSKKIGTQGKSIDFALLVDGLAAEREQGITIDVAYRFFSTDHRKFIVADSPGHEQYTRNMATAASNADLAIILIDARNGILPQTKRHSFLVNLMGIKNVIIAINKMDLIDYKKDTFEDIVEQYKDLIAEKLDFSKMHFIPVSALQGDNIVKKSRTMDWYKGNTLIKLLEDIDILEDSSSSFSMPIQYVNRPSLNFRGFCGTVSSGNLSIGDDIKVSNSQEIASIKEIFLGDHSVQECQKGDSVTITLNKEIDISRGDVLFNSDFNDKKNNGFLVNLIWFDANEAYQNRSYILKTANSQINCNLVRIKNKINVNTFEKIKADSLSMNDIAECELMLDKEISSVSYGENRCLGNLILIDKKTNLTVAAGTFIHDLRRSTNVKWQNTEVDRYKREEITNQKAFVVWFTGLSGSGKSTVANLLEKKLVAKGHLTYMLDGDNLRFGLNKDLGFKKHDRIENIRRVGEVSKILYDSAVIVIASFISPYKKDRKTVRNLFPKDCFFEVHMDASIDSLKKRDPKGLYSKAVQGEIPNFTGIGSEYESPKNAEIKINSDKIDADQAADKIFKYLAKKNVIRN